MWNCPNNSIRGCQLKTFAEILDLTIAFPDSPTRFGYNSANIIDFALINNFNFPFNINSIAELSSDHNPVILNFSLLPPIHHDNSRAVTTCWSAFKNNLKNNVKILDYQGIKNPTVLEDKIEFFTAAVRSAHQFASKPIANKKHAYTPNYIHNLIRDKNRAKKKYNNTLNPIDKQNYYRLQEKLKKELKKISQENWNNKLESLNTRDNSLWQCQRFFRKKRSNIPSLTSSSGVANSDDQKANILASTLQNNFSENKRPGDGRHPIDQEITNTLNNFFDNHPLIPISPTEPDEILTYIKSLKNNKAPDSYRPISLLSILSKITEYVILNRLKSYTNENNFINPNQYGFTRNLSTYHPLLGLTEKITAGFQRGRSTGAVFLDIKKALTGSGTFQVRVNDTLSSSLSIKYGVPQGSLLGPLLFNIYINDIPTHPQTSTNIYADDTVTLATYKNHNTITIALNNHLKLLETFFDTWKIKINIDKTIAVLFTNRKTQPTPPTLYSTQLQCSQSTKYLGLTLDKKLTWKQHIIQTRDKFRRAQRAIFPLIGRNSELNLYNKLLLYTAVLRPILTYGSPVWNYAANSNIKILEVAQNSLIRNIVKANRYARNSKIYEDIKIIPFKAYIQKLAISFFNSLPNSNNENVKMLNNYIPMPDLKRPRRILLDSYNPP
ncbi:probable RNA-directed DNA polymerase from transposon X-element [Trichonephila clavipes]|nr:probable RNA-directed DNA polymerase from transposon X-element [Trichonephila clavipes]